MREETTLNFEQTKELSYLNTLFDMVDRSRKRRKLLDKLSGEIKNKDMVVYNEIEKTHERLNNLGLSDYMIKKHINNDYKYKFVYFLRRLHRKRHNESKTS